MQIKFPFLYVIIYILLIIIKLNHGNSKLNYNKTYTHGRVYNNLVHTVNQYNKKRSKKEIENKYIRNKNIILPSSNTEGRNIYISYLNKQYNNNNNNNNNCYYKNNTKKRYIKKKNYKNFYYYIYCFNTSTNSTFLQKKLIYRIIYIKRY